MFFDEMTHLVFLATAILLFVVAFLVLSKVVIAHLPFPGLQQTIAAAA